MFRNIIILLFITLAIEGYSTVQETGSANDELTTTGYPDNIDVAETQSTQKHEDTVMENNENQESSVPSSKQTENLTTPDPFAALATFKGTVEEALRSWIRNLDCYKTSMGVMRCWMVKKISSEYYNNKNRDPALLKTGIRYLIKILMANNQVDPDLKLLIKKYAYLNDV